MNKPYIMKIAFLFRLFEKDIINCVEYKELVERVKIKYGSTENK